MFGQLMSFAQSLVYCFEIAVFIWIAKALSDVRVSNHFCANTAIEEESNLAVALQRGGMYLAIAVGMIGALTGNKGTSFLGFIGSVAIDGVLITIFVLIARVINDSMIAHGIDNDTAVKKGNVAVGLVEGGGYIATGLIAYASFTGLGGPWWSSIVYFVLGQAVLVGMTIVYEKVTPWNVNKEIREGNVSAGLMLAGMMIAIGFILKGAIAGPFNGWEQDLQAFAISALAGILMLVFVFNKAVDHFLLPGTNIQTEVERDKNVAAVVIVVSVKIALALGISTVVI